MGYDWARTFGLLAIDTGGNKYTVLRTKVYVEFTDPTAYNTHINRGTSDYQQKKKSADHKFLSGECYTYFGTEGGISKSIQYALDLTY